MDQMLLIRYNSIYDNILIKLQKNEILIIIVLYILSRHYIIICISMSLLFNGSIY